MPEWVIQLGVVTMIGGIGWFLRSKDEFQAKQIALLFVKHDEDAKALQDLRIQIASNHYVKQELDSRFDKLEAAFKSGFNSLGDKFDRLADKLTQSNGHGN